ncbi:MAG: efflux RND transporter periplasmic adaptor subunit [Desulfosudaceae bacterium]
MRQINKLAGLVLAVSFLSAGTLPAQEGEGVWYRGLVAPSEVIEVSSQVPGIIDRVTVERGDRIAKGKVLAELRAGVEKAQVELAEARLEFGRRKVERNRELYEKQLISIHEKDEMETEVRIRELQLKEAEERLALRTIRSPVTGVVVERYLGSGEYVGDEGAIMKIARIDPLNVELVVPAERYRTIDQGMTVRIRPQDPLGGSYQGRVVIVDEVIDAASSTFGVRVRLPNPGHRIPAGINCQVGFSE